MLVFYVLWLILAYDTPDSHPTITEKEKNYIKQQIGTSISKQKVYESRTLFLSFRSSLTGLFDTQLQR